MSNLKEIVTKAVIGKTKKTTKEILDIDINENINNVLGCWIINHNFNGYTQNGKVNVNGSYDINVWYSYDDNTKTNVLAKNFQYNEIINVKLKENESLTDDHEIIVRSLTAPSVSDVKIENSKINLKVDHELGVEVVGDTKVRINVEDDYDDYEEELDTQNIDIDENYLNGVNQN